MKCTEVKIMREILFRGQTRRYGEQVKMNGDKVPSNWVYGGVCQGKGDFSIIYGSMDMELEQPTEKRVVYTNTIGQYTGLTDKNGTKIFEGDIVKIKDYSKGCALNYEQPTSNWVVKWDEKYARFSIDYMSLLPYKHFGESEVIGNIHDNPELLGGKDNE